MSTTMTCEEKAMYYASECGGGFGVFTKAGYQVGGWWPSLVVAQQVADLLNQEVKQ